MLDRFMNQIKAMLNKGISQAETPEILAQQAQDQLETSITKLKEALTGGLAQEKMLEQQIKKNKEDLAMWEQRAATAVQQGNDEIARQCLQKKREHSEQAQTLESQLAEQEKTTAALKVRSAELDEELRDFRNKKTGLIARAQAGEALAKANELLSGASGSGMDKWEQKIREKEARGAALDELGGDPTADKFKELDTNSRLDDELAALKEQMGAPRLVVNGEVVDENLPMVIDESKPDDDKGKAG